MALQTRLFQGGYEDFTTRTSFFSHDQAGPSRHSLLEDLIHYWTTALPPSFTITSASLLTLSYYPLQIIAAEWVRYIAVLSHNIKQYEYTYDPLVANATNPPGLNYLDANLRNLQVWGRRCIQTLYKLDLVTSFLRNHTPSASDNSGFDEYKLLAEDYDHIKTQIQTYQHRLEALIPVVTSLVQIVDTRRSLNEAANVTRLTYLALLFVPLSFVTGLFSMQGAVERQVWEKYFEVAIPVCLVVFGVATLAGWRGDWWGSIGRKSKGLLR